MHISIYRRFLKCYHLSTVPVHCFVRLKAEDELCAKVCIQAQYTSEKKTGAGDVCGSVFLRQLKEFEGH